MPSWFKKVFKSDAAKPAPRPTYEGGNGAASEIQPLDPSRFANPILDEEPEENLHQRRIINPPVLVDEEEMSGWTEEICIKARPEDHTFCVFMVDRPVFEGYSAWFPTSGSVDGLSPLADTLFTIKEIDSVLIHDMTVTVTRDGGKSGSWKELAAQVGAVIREHLKNGEPVMAADFAEALPSEDDIRMKIQSVVDLEINPGIAAHSGVITLENVKGNTLYITMGGGCQGCAASAITLRRGIHEAFRRAVPQVGAILDETDHSSGTNPYYKELPPEMRSYA